MIVILRRLPQPSSSSPSGQSLLPSQRPALEIHIPVLWQRKAWTGQRAVKHSSSEPSLQSCLPSQTKNQLIQVPELLHWKVPTSHPGLRALQVLFLLPLETQSQTLFIQSELESAI